MVQLNREIPVTVNPPNVMKSDYVCYWAEKEGILIGDQEAKVKAYIANNCIVPADGGWDILPIKGTKRINHIRNGECKCQHFQTYHTECSHIKAVRVWQFMEKYNDERRDNGINRSSNKGK